MNNWFLTRDKHLYLICCGILIASCFPTISYSSERPIHISTSEFLKKYTPKQSAEITEALKEANNKFTYKGKPIHPDLIAEFTHWISDTLPTTLAVDVSASYGSNEYFSGVEKKDLPAGLYHCTINDVGNKTKTTFCYSHRHKAPDDIHFLEVFTYNSDEQRNYRSTEFEMEVKFEIWSGINYEGKIYEQLVLKLVGLK